MDQIEVFLNQALEDYHAGASEKAKNRAQDAYFQIFENLEGPIRVNISAKKAYELESEFSEIRKMIVRGEPYAEIAGRVKDLLSELEALVPILEKGFVLRAEKELSVSQPHSTSASKDADKRVSDAWTGDFLLIQSLLKKALVAYKEGRHGEAKDFVAQAHLGGYKNSLMETAVRRFISLKEDTAIQTAFRDMKQMFNGERSSADAEQAIGNFLSHLQSNLQGLPLIHGKVSLTKNEAQVEKNWRSVSDRVLTGLEQAVSLYEKGRNQEAAGLVQDTYFDVFEASGFERALGARNEGLKARLEGAFSELISEMKSSGNHRHEREILTRVKLDLENALKEMSTTAESPFALFFYSLMIILREGMEAILIITAIIAYLLKIGSKDKLGVIYHGCLWAIIASLITAFFVREIYHVSPANQEVLEGFTVLLAAGVLFFVSFWLISKAEAQRWMGYIKNQVGQSVSKGSLRALWFVAFLAVYREGAETVLFYQALGGSQSGPSGILPITAGFSVGFGLLILVYWVLRSGIGRIPIKPFFVTTGLFLYYMSFVFVGKGMMELIEGKIFQPIRISWISPIPWLGVFPYWQTILPQFFLVLAALTAWCILNLKRSKDVLTKKEVVQ